MAFSPNPQGDGAFGSGGSVSVPQTIDGGLGINALTVGSTTTISTDLLGGNGIQLLPQVGNTLEIATDLSGGTGITITPNGTQQVLANTGILSVVAGSGGISVSLGQNPVVSATTSIVGDSGTAIGYVPFPAMNVSDDGQGNFTLSPNLYPFSGQIIVPQSNPNINIYRPGVYWILASPANVGDLQLGINVYQSGSYPGRYYIMNNNGTGNNNMNIFAYIYSAGSGTQTVIASGTQCAPSEGIQFDLTYTTGSTTTGQVSVIRFAGGTNSTKIQMTPASQNA